MSQRRPAVTVTGLVRRVRLAVIHPDCTTPHSASRRSRKTNGCERTTDYGVRLRDEACLLGAAGCDSLAVFQSTEPDDAGDHDDGDEFQFRHWAAPFVKFCGSSLMLSSSIPISWAPVAFANENPGEMTSASVCQSETSILYCGLAPMFVVVMT